MVGEYLKLEQLLHGQSRVSVLALCGCQSCRSRAGQERAQHVEG